MTGAAQGASGVLGIAAVFLPPPFNIIAAVAAIAISLIAAQFAQQPKAKRAPAFELPTRQRSVVLRGSIEPRVRTVGTDKLASVLAYGNSNGKANRDMHLVLLHCDGPIEGYRGWYLNDVFIEIANLDANGWVQSGRYANKVRFKYYTGEADQLADPDLVAAFAEWTDNHRLRGIAYSYVLLRFSDKVFPSGPPQISALIDGENTVLDPRDQSVGFTHNWALNVLHYLRQDWGLELDADEWDSDTMIAAANLSDELVSLTPGGSQARYTCDGAMTLDAKPIETAAALLTAGNGLLPYSEGAFKLYGGAYRVPSITITEDDHAGEITLQTAVDLQGLYNRVRGTFVDPTDLYEPTDFPPVKNAAYETQDGKLITRTIELPFTQDVTRAQRIAKQINEASRFSGMVTWPGMPSVVNVQVGEPIMVDLAKANYSGKVFMPLGYNITPAGIIELLLREDAAAIYAWSPSDATDPDAPAAVSDPNPDAADVFNLSARQIGSDLVQIAWDESDPRPFGYRLAYGPVGGMLSNVTLIDDKDRGTQVATATIPPGTWVVYLWAVDEGDNLSAAPASTQVTVVNFNDIVFGTEQAPRWAGARTAVVVSYGGALVPTSTKTSDNATFAELYTSYGSNFVAQSIYEVEIDLGFDAAGVRLFAELAAVLGPGITLGVGAAPVLVDTRLNADTYDGFVPLVPGLADLRFAKFRVVSDNTTGKRRIDGFRPVLDVKEETVPVQGLVIPIGGANVIFPQRFHLAPNFAPTVDQPASPLFVTWGAVSVTGVTGVKVVDNSAIDVGGTINYTVIGPLGRKAA